MHRPQTTARARRPRTDLILIWTFVVLEAIGIAYAVATIVTRAPQP